jgi:diguanylate cyclase (GGDEF)-like protein
MNAPAPTPQRFETGMAAAYSLACVAAGLWLRQQPDTNAAPLGLVVTVLLAGYAYGPVMSWMAALVSGLVLLGFYNFSWISLPLLVSALGGFLMAAIYPLPWHLRHEQEEVDFRRLRQPLQEAKDLAEEQLKHSRAEAETGKQRSKESDALFMVSREISKVLTLQDMVAFTTEQLMLALKKRRGGPKGVTSTRFAILLLDEGSRRFRLAGGMGIAAEESPAFEAAPGDGSLMAWLAQQARPIHLNDVHEDPVLRRLAAPRGIKSVISIPLIIREELMGLIVAHDLVASAFSREDFNDLRILGSQLSIGVKKATLYDKVQRLSITDGLTGLYVHRYLQERLDEEVRRASRYNSPLSFLMIDIDFFKKYNDEHGHLAGDEVLKRVSKVLTSLAGASDLVARYGGEEFAFILPAQDKPAAMAKAESIRKAIEEQVLVFDGQETHVTISCGLASFPQDAMTKNGLIDRSDQALYEAKSQGRNRVVATQDAQ